jgi:hypothetical protein
MKHAIRYPWVLTALSLGLVHCAQNNPSASPEPVGPDAGPTPTNAGAHPEIESPSVDRATEELEAPSDKTPGDNSETTTEEKKEPSEKPSPPK